MFCVFFREPLRSQVVDIQEELKTGKIICKMQDPSL